MILLDRYHQITKACTVQCRYRLNYKQIYTFYSKPKLFKRNPSKIRRIVTSSGPSFKISKLSYFHTNVSVASQEICHQVIFLKMGSMTQSTLLIINSLMLTAAKSSLPKLLKSCSQKAKVGKYLKEEYHSEHPKQFSFKYFAKSFKFQVFVKSIKDPNDNFKSNV